MKYVEAKFVKGHSTGHNCFMGDSYVADCPYCNKQNLLWPSELDPEKVNGTNKCMHFAGLTKNNKLIFKDKFEIFSGYKGVWIDDVLFKERTLSDVFCILDDIADGDGFYPSISSDWKKLFVFSSPSRGGYYINDRGYWLKEELTKLLYK